MVSLKNKNGQRSASHARELLSFPTPEKTCMIKVLHMVKYIYIYIHIESESLYIYIHTYY